MRFSHLSVVSGGSPRDTTRVWTFSGRGALRQTAPAEALDEEARVTRGLDPRDNRLGQTELEAAGPTYRRRTNGPRFP